MKDEIENSNDLPIQNWMIDIETTGLNPYKHAITSLAAVAFTPGNYADINHAKHDLHFKLELPAKTAWDSDTVQWRHNHHVDTREADLDFKSLKEFFIGFENSLTLSDTAIPIVWAKPTLFDIGFLNNYYDEFGNEMPLPWHWRDVVDVNSYIRGLGEEPYADSLYKQARQAVSFGQSHDALYDCKLQIALIWAALESSA